MKLKIKKLHQSANISKAHDSDAGFDLTAVSMELVDKEGHGYIEYGTGVSVQPEEGYVVLILPRSSISKTGLWLANSIGLIDPGYTGEVKARFKYVPKTEKYTIGDKVCQILVIRKEQVDLEFVEELQTTDRMEAGFGSSGN